VFWFEFLVNYSSLFQSSRSFINMPDYTPHEIIDMILILAECRENYRAAARLYCEHIRRIWSFRIVFSVRDKDNLSDLGLNVVHWKQYD